MGKVIGALVAAIAVIAIVVVVFVVQNLDGIIKGVIEDTGSRLTGTPVRVSSVKFDLGQGRGEILGLTIGNPPGYTTPQLGAIAKVAVEIAPASVTGPVILIREVTVDGAEVTAEQRGTRTNLQDLLDNLQQASQQPEEPAGEGSDVRLAMESFRFTDGRANVVSEQLGERTVKLPSVSLDDVGDPATGVTPAELGQEITAAVIRSAEKAVTGYLGDLAKDAAKQELEKKLGSDAASGLEGVKQLFRKD
jgi:hypothetical protein